MHSHSNKKSKEARIVVLYARVSFTEAGNVDKKADWSTDSDKQIEQQLKLYTEALKYQVEEI